VEAPSAALCAGLLLPVHVDRFIIGIKTLASGLEGNTGASAIQIVSSRLGADPSSTVSPERTTSAGNSVQLRAPSLTPGLEGQVEVSES
jgi:hypothetical protein